jgi:hypothetical protein
MSDLLTAAEHNAVTTAALLANQVAEIITDGPSRDGDLAEAAHHIHAVQRMILAQAAARAYPDRYRTLGGVVPLPPPSWWPKSPESDSLTAAVDAYRGERGL